MGHKLFNTLSKESTWEKNQETSKRIVGASIYSLKEFWTWRQLTVCKARN